MRSILSSLLVALLLTAPAVPATADEAQLADDAVALLQEYIRIDTTNPPGDESKAVDFFTRILAREGIAYEKVETGAGRGNIWARLEGGDEPGLVMLHHMDVVSADAGSWDVPPFAGEMRDGLIYGRGALDMKSHGIIHLMALIALHRAGVPLNRDVLFLATADEEVGSKHGMEWMTENRRDLFEGIALGLTEGGAGAIVSQQQIFTIEVTQKIPVWLRLEASGEPGHGSTPRITSAVERLLTALERFRAHRFEPRMIPSADLYFAKIAPQFGGKMQAGMRNMGQAIKDDEFMRSLHERLPNLFALTQTTCAITRLEGSNKINVVPPRAAAEIDCRLLPDENIDAFLRQVEAIVDDPGVTVTPQLALAPRESRTDTVLYRAIETTMAAHYPDAAITPGVATGFTDGQYLRGLGIATYGFAPFLIPIEDLGGYHGNNERISAENMRRGTLHLLEILRQVVHSE